MKVKYALSLPGKAAALLAVLLTACLVVITLAVACDEEAERPTRQSTNFTPTGTSWLEKT